MKVGTDALLLGSWAGEVTFPEPLLPHRILDIGTGSGILALMLAQRYPLAWVDAVELEPEAAKQAAQNVQESPFSDRIVVHPRAIQGWAAKADLVVCNPPFFHDHPKSTDRKRNLARHDDTLPLSSLFSTVKSCMNPEGEFCLVFPEDRARELREVALSNGFHCRTKIQLRASKEHEVIRSLWSWGLEPAMATQAVWDIEGKEGGGSWSPSIQARLEPFVATSS